METLKFKTNIKCGGCVANVTPALNKTAGENNWQIDLQHPDKTLTIASNASEIDVLAAVKEAGYQAEKI